MTIALWCVLAGALLPYLWTAAAKRLGRYSLRDNHQPRDFQSRLTGPAARAHAAQLNGFEAFPAFAAAVLVAQYVHAAQARIDLVAIVWVVLRLAHGVLYVADMALWRSLIWFGSMACVVALFIQAA